MAGAYVPVHTTVLRDTIIKYLEPADDRKYIDCTLGEGGHSEAILQAAPGAIVYGFDQDPAIIERARQRLDAFAGHMKIYTANFSEAQRVLADDGITEVDGIVMDLGISSFHYSDSGRGFSFHADEPLDMRLSPDALQTAADVVNSMEERELRDIFFTFGEERYAKSIARRIVQAREQAPVQSSRELAELISSAVPAKVRHAKLHPATRVFQALRIAVNRELDVLETSLSRLLEILRPGGRLCVISFHSLEDRIVKHFIKENLQQCRCPDLLPRCVCGMPGTLKKVSGGAVVPDAAEIAANHRARSAKLRVAERL